MIASELPRAGKASPVVAEVRRELAKYTDRKYRINAQQFSKQKLKDPWVLKTSILRRVSGGLYKIVRDRTKKEIFELCEELLRSGDPEQRAVAFDWAHRQRQRYQKSDFRTFERWLKSYVTGWGSCDNICTRALGEFLFMLPRYVPNTERWARSRNQWVRRGSAVALIYSLRAGQLLPQAFKVADLLLLDKEDMVQKGYGWMLKEAGNRFPDEVFRFVMGRKERMPRTALRYAIEKMPQERRRAAMSKDS
jgi:3-methyladenine DNA glycosylase AlkD